MQEDQLRLANNLWTRGAGHLLGAQALFDFAYEEAKASKMPDPEHLAFNGKYSSSVHLLVGFAAELLLKSAYILRGGDSKELGPRGLGHDLVRAFSAAEAQGFSSAAPKLREIVEVLRKPHIEHEFRYGQSDVLLPEPDDTFAALNYLTGEIQAELRPLLGMAD